MGVVHIHASSDADVYYGAGYMQAADRLFQMDLMRRRALGRRAEVLGASVANDDELMRRIGIKRLGAENETMMRAEHPEAVQLVDAWVEGVNARIDAVLNAEVPLPYGFGAGELNYRPERWTTAEALAVGKMIVFGNANQIQYDLLATVLRQYAPRAFEMPLLQPLRNAFILDSAPAQAALQKRSSDAPQRPARALPESAAAELHRALAELSSLGAGASNNWVVAGKHTTNGRPLIANDPHQPLRSPSLMWAHHMNSADAGGTLDVVGFGFVGTPSVQLGHNRHLAWAATTTYPDMMDVWDVEVSATHARIGDEQVAMQLRSETIEVRGEASRSITCEDVPGYGVLLPPAVLPIPVVPEGHRLLLNWTGFRPTREALGFQSFDSARTLEEFEAAVDSMEIAAFNFLGATSAGISYRSSMLVPDQGRASETQPRWALLNGNDRTSFWNGSFLPLNKLPRSRGETKGYVVTANNDPFGFTQNSLFADDPFYFGAFFDPGTRAHRIQTEMERLLGRGKLDVASMQTLQGDTYSVFADDVIPLLESAFAARATDASLSAYRNRPDLESLVQRLSAWDRRMERESSEAVVFNAFLFFVVRRAVSDEFSLTFGPIIEENEGAMLRFGLLPLLGRVPNAESYLTPGKNLLVLQALDDVAAYLTEKFGTTEPSGYTWGAIHGTQFDHVWPAGQGVGFVSTAGGVGTVNVSDTNLFSGADTHTQLKASSGAIFRAVTEFDSTGTPIAHVNFPPGNGGQPGDPHFRDTLDDWTANRSRKLLFEDAEIEANTLERLELAR
jgi:penicillin amidase